MPHALKPRRIALPGDCHLELEPDADHPERYLVRFCGLDRDRAARASTESARVRMMLANLRGEAPYPHPLPRRLTIGWLDQSGWHPGRSPLASALATMEAVREAMQRLVSDLMTRVALVAAARADDDADTGRISPRQQAPGKNGLQSKD